MAWTAPGASIPRAAGATSSYWKSFIVSSHDKECFSFLEHGGIHGLLLDL
jgi:hypothetical protein